jgi:hypothetical protein
MTWQAQAIVGGIGDPAQQVCHFETRTYFNDSMALIFPVRLVHDYRIGARPKKGPPYEK